MPVSTVLNTDCISYMKTLPDGYFSLSIADPPYGINAAKMEMGKGTRKNWSKKDWDKSAPDPIFFAELQRISVHAIIWGGNYFDCLNPSKSWIVWDKGIYGDSTFADGEMAWTNFDSVLRIAQVRYKGFLGADKVRIHPTQKPIALYAWILKNYAKKGDTIFDPMMGSQSSRIAAYKLGFDYVGCELDSDYFKAGNERFEHECYNIIAGKGYKIKQLSLF